MRRLRPVPSAIGLAVALTVTGCSSDSGPAPDAQGPSPSATASAAGTAGSTDAPNHQAGAPTPRTHAYARRTVLGVVLTGPRFVPVRSVQTEPGTHELRPTGEPVEITIAPTAKFFRYALVPDPRNGLADGSQSITRAEFDTRCARTRLDGGVITGNAPWNITFDASGALTAAREQPAGSV